MNFYLARWSQPPCLRSNRTQGMMIYWLIGWLIDWLAEWRRDGTIGIKCYHGLVDHHHQLRISWINHINRQTGASVVDCQDFHRTIGRMAGMNQCLYGCTASIEPVSMTTIINYHPHLSVISIHYLCYRRIQQCPCHTTQQQRWSP